MVAATCCTWSCVVYRVLKASPEFGVMAQTAILSSKMYGAPIEGPLRPLDTIVLWCFRGQFITFNIVLNRLFFLIMVVFKLSRFQQQNGCLSNRLILLIKVVFLSRFQQQNGCPNAAFMWALPTNALSWQMATASVFSKVILWKDFILLN